MSNRFSDWLRTLRTGACREDLGSPRDFQNEPLAPAERLRLVSKMLEDILYSNPQDVESLQTHKPFTHAAAYFPLHDDRFNERWLKQWSKAQLFIPDEQLSDIRDHFGDGIALYFEFLRFYFRALAFPAFTGLCTWFGGHYFSKLYSIGLVIWSVVFVESWSIRERQLAVRWGTLGISQDNIDLRPGFKPEQIITSPITGRKVPHSPWWKREGRMLAGLPALVAFALALATMICCIFSAEGEQSGMSSPVVNADPGLREHSHYWRSLQWTRKTIHFPSPFSRVCWYSAASHWTLAQGGNTAH